MVRVDENMAWPRDKALIIEALEDSISRLHFVKRHLEMRYRETGDALDLAAGEKIEQVFLTWRFIRSFHFEQGRLFEGEHGEDQDPEAMG